MNPNTDSSDMIAIFNKHENGWTRELINTLEAHYQKEREAALLQERIDELERPLSFQLLETESDDYKQGFISAIEQWEKAEEKRITELKDQLNTIKEDKA